MKYKKQQIICAVCGRTIANTDKSIHNITFPGGKVRRAHTRCKMAHDIGSGRLLSRAPWLLGP